MDKKELQRQWARHVRAGEQAYKDYEDGKISFDEWRSVESELRKFVADNHLEMEDWKDV